MIRIPWPSLNLWRVCEWLYRSAQPELADLPRLREQFGIALVIDLRDSGEHDTVAECAACTAAGITYLHVPMDAVRAPTQAQIALVLEQLDSNVTLVHCAHGEDRTGVVIACWEHRHGVAMEAILQDFYYGHTRGLWGEYWMLAAVCEFARG